MRAGHARLVFAAATPLVVAAIGILAHGGAGQAAATPASGISRAITISRPTVVGPLRDIRLQRPTSYANRRLEGEPENARYPLEAPPGDVRDPVVQGSAAGSQVPAPLRTFEGMNNISRVVPPDANGDVGPTHYMQWVNGSFAVYDKTTGALVYGPAAGSMLFAGLPNCGADSGFDPVVLYDQFAGRWVSSYFAPYTGNRMCVAVSRTSDPTGTWCAYEFLPNPAQLLDYPKLGVWPSQNAYLEVVSGVSGPRLAVVGYERDRMLECEAARLVYKDMSEVTLSLPFLLPADAEGKRRPPRGAPAPLVGLLTAVPWGVQVWKARIDWGTTPSISVVHEADLRPAPYDTNFCDYSRKCIPQPGTTQRLDALSSVLMDRVQYRSFGGRQTLVASHSVDTGGDHAGVRWYRIEKTRGRSWQIADQGTFAPDAVNRWLPSIAMDASGDLAIGYSVSDGSSVYPGIRYTGRLATDPPGQMEAEDTIATGTGAQLNLNGRWGDYAAMAVDPVDDCTFYLTSEYVQTTGTSTWQTRIGAFRFPSCRQAAPAPRCVVPRVVGLTLGRAKARIRARGCKIGRVRRVRARRAGRVLRQSPRAGAVRPRGSKISLSVGRR